MSMLGLSVGTTVSATIERVSKNRVRMSFWFEPTTSEWIGAPMRRAIQPASTLPKFPVGTLNDVGRHPSCCVAYT